MACTLSNKCAKNLSKRTVLLQLIIKSVVTCFFWNTVYIKIELYCAQTGKVEGLFKSASYFVYSVNSVAYMQRMFGCNQCCKFHWTQGNACATSF